MKFAKIRDVKPPCRGTSKSAGIDFFVPNYSEAFLQDFKNKNSAFPHDTEKFTVRPHERVLIPSGIKVEVPDGFALFVNNKSGVATKKGLAFMANVIDQDYMGELHVSLVNTSDQPVEIAFGEKIVQMVLLPVNYAMPEECKLEDLYVNMNSERGEGGFGSTGVI